MLGAAVMAAVVLAAAGCQEEEPIAAGPRLLAEPQDVESVKRRLMSSAVRWSSLEARCSVIIRSDYIRARPPQVNLRGGRLRIVKPESGEGNAKVHLRVPAEGPAQVVLVGDGEQYRVEMPLFAGGPRYTGSYGDPVPGEERIPLMPDDLADAFHWSNLFLGKVQVPRHDNFSFCVDSLQPVREPRPALRLVYTIMLGWRDGQMVALRKYNEDGSLRVEVRFLRWDTYQVGGEESVEVPTRVWLGYGGGRTATIIDLSQVELNPEPGEGTFRTGR